MDVATHTAKRFRCRITQDRWAYETDADIIESPTGTRLRVPAHRYDYHPLYAVLRGTILRACDGEEKEQDDTRIWHIAYLTAEEMQAWKQVYHDTQNWF